MANNIFRQAASFICRHREATGAITGFVIGTGLLTARAVLTANHVRLDWYDPEPFGTIVVPTFLGLVIARELDRRRKNPGPHP